ncbi:DNA-directed RNA polymerase subunit beta' [Patescibacteria group bacterium]|nr:DNA-directed RNA polymerase subunit beta' [Patescibacteria group bacterium]MBU4308898.1 DNA-directed RNA polymerase subunit beta' [Patescibacteria group bacterium]MBU4432600.1 DNA-directed RNA polymerase subunit beta' [Patescibacteria group bacterium]MBU4577258.1 DNA-directed RNA polymerase subunit beta' [Patescibacteria group bacterium]
MLNPIKTTDFNAVKLKLASPEVILSWSHGEVTRPETINYRTQKPEKNGLFCEKIFGPSKDWECYCGKYKKIRYKGIVCDKCGVEVTRSIVRRERMGHIELETPCTHIWFLRGLSSKIGLLLGLSMQALEKVVYFANFIITDVDEELKMATLDQIKTEFASKKKSIEGEFNRQVSEIKAEKQKMSKEGKSVLEIDEEMDGKIVSLKKVHDEKMENLNDALDQAQKELKELVPLLIISESVYQNLSLKYGHIFEAGIGAESVRGLLEKIDLEKTIAKLQEDLVDCLDSKRDKLVKRLKLAKSLLGNSIKPEWMIMTHIPVIPPDLRPMVALDGGRYATSDLNDLYRRVINRNNRLKQLTDLSAPEVICRNEKRMLQEAVDALIDNSARHGKTVIASTGQKRMLKSLADSLKGKQGRFRQNLLGKRIDYSGRSVIVVNPKLRLDQCGLPKIMAIELFKPFVISKLIEQGIVHNVRSASRFMETGADVVWDILEDIIKGSFVMLNRAPTLHRLGIQAFRPILIEGKAIQIHPSVCSAFNADFDGDQMAVHVPLTKEAIWEAENIMLSTKNILKPATGDPVVAPSQDIVWGSYYLTNEVKDDREDKQLKKFSSENEVILAYDAKAIKLQEPMLVKLRNGEIIRTTAGRVMFNDILPDKLRFINKVVDKGVLKNIVKDSFRYYGADETVTLIDELKDKSFDFITRSGLSWSMGDLPQFDEKDALIDATQEKVEEIQEQFEEGLLTDSERYSKIIELWTSAKDRVTDICKKGLPIESPVYSMIESGARGSWAQLTQILGMKGLVTSPSGDIIELPIKGNFKKGFGVLEYFIATHGVRKGLSDTALRTANAGYLTRRLVDVSQDMIVTQEDCGDTEGMVINKKESEEMGTTLANRVLGRNLAKDLVNTAGKVLVKADTLIDDDIYDEIKNEDIEEATIRAVLSCKLSRGVCMKCYGWDLGYNKTVKMGTAVGVIAAQSIGEPGTQLTMRTFHTGGVAGVDDITQGLPRVEEIFEARAPKRKAFLAEESGRVQIESAQKVVDGKSVPSSSHIKILKIYYMGHEINRYGFAEAITKAKLAAKSDKKEKAPVIGKKDVKVLVENGQKIIMGQELFKVGKEIVTSEVNGKAILGENSVKVEAEAEKFKEYILAKGTAILVQDGDDVKKGDTLTDGSLDLQELFRYKGQLDTQKYIIREIQNVYSSQGQPLNDKHIEIISRQMFSRFFIRNSGNTSLMSGEIVESSVVDRALRQMEGGVDDTLRADRLLMGITKASLTTDSFLSAASFQETARVLIDASVTGKVDYLEGLKENVIIGRLIPSGTGYRGLTESASRKTK